MRGEIEAELRGERAQDGVVFCSYDSPVHASSSADMMQHASCSKGVVMYHSQVGLCCTVIPSSNCGCSWAWLRSS